jgi:hypothetical protein
MLIPGSERPPTMSRARSGGGRSGAAARPVSAAFAAIITDRTLAERRHPGVGVVGVAHSVNTRPSLAHSSGTASTWASISRLMWVRITRVAPSSARWAAMAG